jgi:hypothetical protein
MITLKPFTPNTPGVFRMEAEDYHAAPGIGKHSLDYIADCPLKYALYKQHGVTPTGAMELGTLLHTAVLEPKKLREAFHVRPIEYTNEKGESKAWNSNAKVCQSWMESHTDKPIIKASEVEKINNIVTSVHQNPIAGPIVTSENLLTEVSMFSRCEHTGILKKGRADGITIDDEGRVWMIDCKFVNDASKEGFRRQVQDLRYYVQAAYYTDLIKELVGLDVQFLFFAVETSPMHEQSDVHRVMTYALHPLEIEMGRNNYLRDLQIYKRCVETGNWPGNMDRIHVLTLSNWFRRENAS